MQSTTHTNTHNAGTAAAAFRRRWPALALGICALLALAILAVSAEPAGPRRLAKQIGNRYSPLRPYLW